MKILTATAAALACAGLVQTFNVRAAQPMACADLVQLNLGADVKIDSAVEMAEGTPLRSIVPAPASLAPTCSHDVVANTLRGFCRVQATIDPTSATSKIKIEVWLPLEGWNGKFQGYGNHGFAGNIDYVDLGPELNKGYAVAGTDTGHQGGGTAWMQDPTRQAIINYGSRGIHEMAVKAKAITEAFYGKAPKYSYFNGCSTGGKEGLMAAQRYPDDFDGINIGGSANFDQIGNRVQYVWNGQVTFGRGVPLAGPTLTLINNAVVAACDMVDGIADGVLDDPRECDFQPSSMLCKAGQDPTTCLSALQVDALEKVYQGPRNPRTGAELYPGLVRGSERGWGGHTAGPNIFSTADQFFKFMVYNNPAWDYRTFNFDSDFAYAKNGFSSLIDAVDPSLDAFRKRGGKLLFSHLWSSTTHAATKSIEYYEEVARRLHGGDKDNGYTFGKTQEFFRLFMVPSASGSKGPDTFDSMPLLEKWVEQGIPPKSILAVHKTSGVVDRTRIVCPYPQRAVWTGEGSTDDAANFVCRNKGNR